MVGRAIPRRLWFGSTLCSDIIGEKFHCGLTFDVSYENTWLVGGRTLYIVSLCYTVFFVLVLLLCLQ